MKPPGDAERGGAEPGGESARSGGLGRRGAAVLVVGLAAAAYANSIGNGFAYDDFSAIVHNRVVRGGSLADVARSTWWGSLAPGARSHGYRPLTVLTFRADAAVHGVTPAGFHAVNVALHAGACLLVLALAWRVGLSPLAAGAAAAVFAVHPLHTEAVAGIVGRAEVLAAAAVIGGLILHARGRAAAAAAVYLAGLLAKESAVVLPAIALVWDLATDRGLPRARARAYAGYGVALAVYLLARLLVTGLVLPTFEAAPLDNPLAHLAAADRLRTAAAVLGRYALLCLWPARLSADYGLGALPVVRSLADPWLLLGAISLGGAIAGAAWGALRGCPAVALAGATWSLAILPVSNLLVPIHTIMGERLTYLASAGFCLAAGMLLDRLRAAAPGAAFAVLAAAVTLLGARTVVRNRDWRDNVALFAAAYAVTPGSARVQNNYGNVLVERGDPETALAHYRRAAAIYPDYVDAWINQARTLAALGRPAEARAAAAEAASARDRYLAAGRVGP